MQLPRSINVNEKFHGNQHFFDLNACIIPYYCFLFLNFSIVQNISREEIYIYHFILFLYIEDSLFIYKLLHFCSLTTVPPNSSKGLMMSVLVLGLEVIMNS